MDTQDPWCKQVLSSFYFLNEGQNIWVIPRARAIYYMASHAEGRGCLTLNTVAGQKLKFFLP